MRFDPNRTIPELGLGKFSSVFLSLSESTRARAMPFGSPFSNDCLFPEKMLRKLYWVLSHPNGGFLSTIELGLMVQVSEEFLMRNPSKNLGELKGDEMGLV